MEKEETLEGKVLKNRKGEEYKVIYEMTYKKIPCVYVQSVTDENVYNFYQLGDDNESLLAIKSKKMLKELEIMLFNIKQRLDKPRRIKEDEDIKDYLAYLDDYYKSKVITII